MPISSKRRLGLVLGEHTDHLSQHRPQRALHAEPARQVPTFPCSRRGRSGLGGGMALAASSAEYAQVA
jgi:hypothetical protein